MSKPDIPLALNKLQLPSYNLERQIVGQKPIEFSQLPESLISGAVHTYSLYLSNLTQEFGQTQNVERGAWVHFNHLENTLLFPAQPDLATTSSQDGRTWQSVTPRFYESAHISPTVFVHSHPYPNSFFSATDLWLMVGEVQQFKPTMSFVSTPQDNYLMIRTAQTPTVTIDQINNKLDNLFKRFSPLATDYVFPLVQSLYSNYSQINLTMQLFAGETPYNYCWQMMSMIEAASQYSLGVYRANQHNNTYNRFGLDQAKELLQRHINVILQSK